MYNSYVCSTRSLSCEGSVPFSFNDFSYYPDDRFTRNPMPLSTPSCCSVCANSLCKVPISSRLLYGLRQSSLIQWSASRKLMFVGAERYYCQFRGQDNGLGSCCCVHVCCAKKRSVCGGRGRWEEGRFRCRVSREERERDRENSVGEAEMMLSLLAEEVGQERFGVGERNGTLSSRRRRVKVEKRRDCRRASYSSKTEHVDSDLLERNVEFESESVRIGSRKKVFGRKEDGQKTEDEENYLRGERCRGRKGRSSCSSYFSCSSWGEFESDTEDQVRQQEQEGESRSDFERNSAVESGEATYEGETMSVLKRQGDVMGGHGVFMRQEKIPVVSYPASTGLGCDGRKKSEKKLTDILVEQIDTREESLHKHMRLPEVNKTGYRKGSSSIKQFDKMEEKSTLTMGFDGRTRQQYSQEGVQNTRLAKPKVKSENATGMEEIHGSYIEEVSSSIKRFSGREENLSMIRHLVQETRDEHAKTAGHLSFKDDYKRNSQELNEMSEIQEIKARGTSIFQKQSEASLNNQNDESTLTLSSVQDTEEQTHLTGQWNSREMDLRRKSKQLTESSDMHEAGDMSHWPGQSGIRMENQEDSSGLHFGSLAEAGGQQFQADQISSRRTESSKESNVLSENRISSQQEYLTSLAVKSTKETIERLNQTDEKVLQVGLRKEVKRPPKALSFNEGSSMEASSSQASLRLKTQHIVQQIGMDVRDRSSSHAKVTPIQLVAGASLHIEQSGDVVMKEASNATSHHGSDVSHPFAELNPPALQHERYSGTSRVGTLEEPLNLISHEDAFGSAYRLQKSSMHHVGEFIEKVTHEVSTSKIESNNKISGAESVSEQHKYNHESSSQYGSVDFRLKDPDSRHSSQTSSVKGPSDEIWDVTEPSIQEPADVVGLPGSALPSTGIVAKRTGKSFWNIISDIIRMQWVSRSRSNNLTLKSGGKSSPNQSTSSEAWFSGHEPEENSDKDVKREERSMSQDSKSADEHHHQVTIATGSQGAGSISRSSTNRKDHAAGDTPSSSGGSSSKGISSVSSGKNFGKRGTGKHHASTSDAVVESQAPLSSLQSRGSPHADEIPEASKTDISASSSLVQMEQQLHAGITKGSGTERLDWQLKQRKLQRSSQILTDKVDEWEETYKHESMQRKIDEMFMREALLEAKKAADTWEVPIGAVLVQHGKVIARGCNLVEELHDSTAHAEMICIREASTLLRAWRLAETTLYVTLEPCPMCAGAILQARIDTVVWGAPNKLLGADGSWIRLFPDGGEGGNGLESMGKPPAPVHPFHPKMTIRRGVLAAECADTMQQFFQLRRKKAKKPNSPRAPSCLPVSGHTAKFLTKMHDAFHFMFCL
ncbi:tRNA(adenine(34)) deaminase, chloroplastic [Diospyros lotus]|uniref:tRNA(adenine(34)) deaminase, chloroplastic n=1 Tax=Diospyros lotus TaxID=55363 RepID=UPI00224F3D55|nr:tRNA(adenine(34)) deaminase, chloroplastic [Diospyros lotus]